MKLAILGWAFNLAVLLAGYQLLKPEPMEMGYSAEYRARLDDLVKNVTPLSVADLGIEYLPPVK
jgi:hypothetical protein